MIIKITTFGDFSHNPRRDVHFTLSFGDIVLLGDSIEVNYLYSRDRVVVDNRILFVRTSVIFVLNNQDKVHIA